MQRRALLLFCALSLLGSAHAQVVNQTLVAENGFPTDELGYLQTWLNILQPARFAVTQPATPPTTVLVTPATTGVYASGKDTIYAVISSQLATEAWTGIDYDGFMHEIAHQGLPPSVLLSGDGSVSDSLQGIIEGLASGKEDLIYATLRNQNPSLFPVNGPQPSVTCAPAIDQYNNRKITVYGGAAGGFYAQMDNEADSPCALLALLINKLGGDYRELDRAINTTLPITRPQFLALVDSLVGTIDGVKPSTLLNYDPTAFYSAPDGTYFGIRSIGGLSIPYQAIAGNDWPLNPLAYFQTLVSFQGGVPTWFDGNFAWSISDLNGKTMMTGAGTAKSAGAMAFYNRTTNQWFDQTAPNGAYLAKAWITDASGNPTTDPNLQDSDVFAILNENLDPGDIAVILNGPQWGQLTAGRTLTLLPPSPMDIDIEQYGNLWVFRHLPQNPDGSYPDLTMTDGTYTRTFTPDRYAPTMRYFKRRDQPMFTAITRTTDYQQVSSVAPGELIAGWGYNFTANDPSVANQLPLSGEGCPGTPTNDQGRTEVVWTTQSGAQYLSPFLYCGFTQVNIQVPLELPVGQTVTVAVVTNGTSSTALTINIIASDPGVFAIDPANTAAAVFAIGPKAGQLVTTSNPAVSGDVISAFGTGFGAKVVPESDGVPATGADQTDANVTATIMGIPAEVLYAGSAPGFVGLDQINLIVPPGASGNAATLIGVSSNLSMPVILPLAQ